MMKRDIEYYLGTKEDIRDNFERQILDEPPGQWFSILLSTFTQEYGGPEEGGWYYNRYEVVADIPLVNAKTPSEMKKIIKNLSDFIYQIGEEFIHGDPYSVLGGEGISLVVVKYEEKAEFLSTRNTRPHYE